MPAPRPFILLSVLAALEGLALLALAGVVAVVAVSGGSYGVVGSTTSAMIIVISIFTVFGLGLLLVARAWMRMSRWARGPFMLAQLIGLLVGISFAFSGESGQLAPGLLLLVPSAFGLILSFNPKVLQVYASTYRRPGSPVDE